MDKYHIDPMHKYNIGHNLSEQILSLHINQSLHLRNLIILLIICFCSTSAYPQYVTKCKKNGCSTEITPWTYVHDQQTDGTIKKSKETTRIYTFEPEKNVSNEKKIPAVIICPGGSYHHLGVWHEGYAVARWFAKQGFAAFVLRYRVSSHGAHHPDMIQDLQLSIALIKKYGSEWIDTSKIGAIGFSAGGHLVLYGGTTDKNYISSEFPESQNYNLRPNYVMAVYPVVSMEDSLAHVRSRKNLLTKQYTEQDKHDFSIEENIPDDMPPTFIFAAHDDDVVDFRNSNYVWQAIQKKSIPNSAFFPQDNGGHGFGMSERKQNDAIPRLKDGLLFWMHSIGLTENNILSSENIQTMQTTDFTHLETNNER